MANQAVSAKISVKLVQWETSRISFPPFQHHHDGPETHRKNLKSSPYKLCRSLGQFAEEDTQWPGNWWRNEHIGNIKAPITCSLSVAFIGTAIRWLWPDWLRSVAMVSPAARAWSAAPCRMLNEPFYRSRPCMYVHRACVEGAILPKQVSLGRRKAMRWNPIRSVTT